MFTDLPISDANLPVWYYSFFRCLFMDMDIVSVRHGEGPSISKGIYVLKPIHHSSRGKHLKIMLSKLQCRIANPTKNDENSPKITYYDIKNYDGPHNFEEIRKYLLAYAIVVYEKIVLEAKIYMWFYPWTPSNAWSNNVHLLIFMQFFEKNWSSTV